MSNLALMEVQHGLYNALHGDGVLMGMISGIYDDVPQDAALPYVMIGDGAQTEVMAEALNVAQCKLAVDVWTEAGGRKTALAIMNRIFALLHLGTLSVSGFQLVLLRCEQAETTISEEGTRVHGQLIVAATVAEV